MDHIKSAEVVKDLVHMGAYKSRLPLKDLLLRAFLSGALLGIATVLAFTVAVQSGLYFLGALAFPVGFAMIILLGLELVTSNFAVVPMALMDKQASMSNLIYSWACAFLGNLVGSVFFGALFFVYITKAGHTLDGPVIDKVIAVAQDKTLGYKQLGSIGLLVVFTKAFLCNWMVSMGAVMGATSSSTIGKLAALWLPIFTFFALRLEHSVVNMFVIPAAMMLKADITLSDWWLWNQIPATLGNIAGAFLMTGAALYFTFGRKKDGK
ncbi:MAG TPA: formate/nitrite transporter family protein [Flavobacteriales bacterium]|nr:formate/nitrite transporter family protein [Flavobacteriales bacterium]